jgi:hypothetical protein
LVTPVLGAASATSVTVDAGAVGTPSITTTGDTNTGIFFPAADTIAFSEGGAEAMRIDSSGNLLVGLTGASYHAFYKNVSDGTLQFEIAKSGGVPTVRFYASNAATDPSAADSCQSVWRNPSTSRSINAAGTINASGADYAEYMTKAGDFSIAKGDVVGINADGKLTNVFADAVSFIVKSTDPSYVGGDVWGNAEALGLTALDDNSTDEEKATFATALEAARQAVDRVAFAGQVPVNVTGATAGQFIVPTNSNGAIVGVAVNEADMTFSQYMKAVGKVIAIEQDGRAKIIVKVA